jgi:HD-GYP domain-containing protein (c-di-GMP phosphodiesterase class II)
MIKIQELPFFSDLDEIELNKILPFTKKHHYKPGSIIIEENTYAYTFSMILQGKVEIYKELEDGDEMIIDILTEGDFFGEMALLDEGLRSASVRALEITTILEISRENFEQLLNHAPFLAFRMMKELSKRLRETGKKLVSTLQEKNKQLQRAYLDTVNALVNSLEARDNYTRGHTGRVTIFTREIAKNMGLKDEALFTIELGALLHDVGKIGVPDAILNKAGPLDKDEFEIIKKHPDKGILILENVVYLKQAVPAVLYHHERFDGSGYPRKIDGKNIPLSGRIIAIADSFDAMTSDRPYRPRMKFSMATEELIKGSGTQFDPEIVDVFLRVWDKKKFDTLPDKI